MAQAINSKNHKTNKEVVPPNIVNLLENQEFKNHRVLCEKMNWEYKDSTDSKKAQLKTLSQYCEWHKDGHKIIIDKVFKKPKAKIKKSNIFLKTVEKAIIEELFLYTKANEGKTMSISKSGLMRKIELFNKNCYEARNNVGAFAKRYDLDEIQVEDILNLNHRSGLDILRKALESLKKQRLITVDETLGLNFGQVSHYNTLDVEASKGDNVKKVKVVDKTLVQYATKEQRDWVILKAERDTLKRYGLNSINDVYNRGLAFTYGEFYPSVMEYIRDNCKNGKYPQGIQALECLEHYYRAYSINFEPSFIVEMHEELGSMTQDDKDLIQAFMQNEELEQYVELGGEHTKHEVSSLNQKRYLTNAQTRHNKALREGSTDSKRHENNYVETAKRINEICYDSKTNEYFTVGKKSVCEIREEKFITR